MPHASIRLFVYGTLKRGESRANHMAGQTFLGPARTVTGYRLYEVESYPGLVEDEVGISIEGELWDVDPQCLAKLDVVECVPELYRRGEIVLEYPQRAAESYFFRGPVAGLRDCGSSWP